MKTNEINRENLIVKPDYTETRRVPIDKVDIKAEAKAALKKDMIHISESKRDGNILDRRVNLIDVPVKLEKPVVNKEGFKEKDLDVAIKKINANTDIINKGIFFEKDNYYDKMVVRIYNKETGDIIKQIPPQDLLDFAKKSEEIMGILFDKTI